MWEERYPESYPQTDGMRLARVHPVRNASLLQLAYFGTGRRPKLAIADVAAGIANRSIVTRFDIEHVYLAAPHKAPDPPLLKGAARARDQRPSYC